jgi:tetratricopeptide (TPR) repeat protein
MNLHRSRRSGTRRCLLLALACAPATAAFAQSTLPATAPATQPATQPTTAPLTPPATLPANEIIAPREADPSLAERFADLAYETLKGNMLTTWHYRQAGTLLEAASRLAPTESRFPRLRHEALLQAGEISGAIESLVAYCRLEPADLQMQARLIELYAQRMETAEEKLKYLRNDIVSRGTISGELRSHAALLAARVLLERGDRRQAQAVVAEATRLNPLNGEAQQLRFDISLRDGTPAERLAGLLAIVRASPVDTGAIQAVADELSAAGLNESVAWYDAALGVSVRDGTPPPRQLVLNYAARLLVAGAARDAGSLADRILEADPADIGAHFIRLAHDNVAGEPSKLENNRALARTAMFNRYAQIAIQAGDAGVTTRPVATTAPVFPPDPVTTAVRVERTADPALITAFISASADLAFLQLAYYNQPRAAAELIDGLRRFLPPDSPLLVRLEGWLFLAQGRQAEARLKLSAVESADPLAALGLIVLDADNAELKPATDARARALRASYNHGVLGAIIHGKLLARGKLAEIPDSQTQTALKQVLATFPQALMRLIDSPQEMYFVRAEPLTPQIEFGQPVMVRVTISNSSAFDLAIGPRGAIRNDLWIDAQVRGLRPALFPAVAYDKLSGPLVLRPRQSASRIVRIDQGRLLTYLRLSSSTSVPVNGTVMTNPVSFGTGFAAGAGGAQVAFSRLVEQKPVPILRTEQRTAMLEGMFSAPPNRRIALIDAAAANYILLRQDTPPEMMDAPNVIRRAIAQLINDPDPTARTRGVFWTLFLSTNQEKAQLSRDLISDPYWAVRLTTLIASRGIERDALLRIVRQSANDTDRSVAAYARAMLDEIEDARPLDPPTPTPTPTSTRPSTLPR